MPYVTHLTLLPTQMAQRALEREVERRLDSVDRLEETLDRRLDTLANLDARGVGSLGTRRINRDGSNYRGSTSSLENRWYDRRSVRDRDDGSFYGRNTWRGGNVGAYGSYGSASGFRDWSRDRRGSSTWNGYGDGSSWESRRWERDGRSSWDGLRGGSGRSWDGYSSTYDRGDRYYGDRSRLGGTGSGLGYGYGYGDRYSSSYGRGLGSTYDRSLSSTYDRSSSWRDGSRSGRSSYYNGLGGDLSYRQRDRDYHRPGIRNSNIVRKIWDTSKPTTVQGGSLMTWSFSNPAVEWLHVLLKSDGRPLDADVELWHGPDNIPQRMRVYVEDALSGTFSAFLGTPRIPTTVAVRNTGQIEFPVTACVGPDFDASADCLAIVQSERSDRIQGGALYTYPFGPNVGSVMVYLETDGRPLNARIEVMQGPNHNKQILDVYTEDGLFRPFMAVIQTPGSGNVVRIVNTAPVEFPMTAVVVPYENAHPDSWGGLDGVVLGRDMGRRNRDSSRRY